MDLRDEVAGTEGTIWLNHFLRTGFEMFSAGEGGGYVAEKAETESGWLFPVGDEISELGYVDMFTDMFDAIDEGRSPRRRSTTATSSTPIMDASTAPLPARLGSRSSSTGAAGRRRASPSRRASDDGQVVIKEEQLPDGRPKLILKDPATGEFVDRIVLLYLRAPA